MYDVFERSIANAMEITNRKGIYYWKSDGSTAFQSASKQHYSKKPLDLLPLVELLLQGVFLASPFEVSLANGQGNHITYYVKGDGQKYFLRIENFLSLRILEWDLAVTGFTGIVLIEIPSYLQSAEKVPVIGPMFIALQVYL